MAASVSEALQEAFRAAGMELQGEALERMEAPRPLPFVSRRATARVRQPLEAPRECPYCGRAPRYVHHREIYGGRAYGKWPYALACACGARVGLHPYTSIPLGTLADERLRQARRDAKELWSTLCFRREWSRSEGYDWLAQCLEVEKGQAHFGWMTLEQCRHVERAARSAMTGDSYAG